MSVFQNDFQNNLVNTANFLTPREHGLFLDVIEPLLYVANREDLAQWAGCDLQRLLPHDSLYCCMGQGDEIGVKDQYSVFLNGFPKGYIEEIKNQAGYIESPILGTWWKTKQPVLFDPQRPHMPYSLNWFKVFEKYRMSNIALHGKLKNGRQGGQTMGDLCFYSFARIHAPLNEKQSFVLKKIIPHLHEALQRVLLSEGQVFKVSTTVKLTKKEKEVLYWMKEGKDCREIAFILMRSYHTVRNQLRKIFEKLEVSNQAQAVVKALELRLI